MGTCAKSLRTCYSYIIVNVPPPLSFSLVSPHHSLLPFRAERDSRKAGEAERLAREGELRAGVEAARAAGEGEAAELRTERDGLTGQMMQVRMPGVGEGGMC